MEANDIKNGSLVNTQGEQAPLTAYVKAHGCAAKLSPSYLGQITSIFQSPFPEELIAGIGNFEDATVYKIAPDLAIVQTVDFFPALVDDPYLFGQIAAANALSDIYAMGAKPLFALNILSFPTCDFPVSTIEEILKGGQKIVELAGAVIGGGHSIQGPEPVYGLAVTGIVHPDKVLANSGAKPGDQIVLSKAIGTGVGLNALKANLLSEKSKQRLLESMITLNACALDIALSYPVHALTDISGFGLIGHVHEMAKASKLTARLYAGQILLLPDVQQMAEIGLVPAATYSNKQAYKDYVVHKEEIERSLDDLLFDPQTSGGLLFALDEKNAQSLCENLIAKGMDAAIIGCLVDGRQGLVEIANHA
jgi:selenide,water dikinase